MTRSLPALAFLLFCALALSAFDDRAQLLIGLQSNCSEVDGLQDPADRDRAGHAGVSHTRESVAEAAARLHAIAGEVGGESR